MYGNTDESVNRDDFNQYETAKEQVLSQDKDPVITIEGDTRPPQTDVDAPPLDDDEVDVDPTPEPPDDEVDPDVDFTPVTPPEDTDGDGTPDSEDADPNDKDVQTQGQKDAKEKARKDAEEKERLESIDIISFAFFFY